jgi:hypothetical protein
MWKNLLLLCHIFFLTSILFQSLIVYLCQVLPTRPKLISEFISLVSPLPSIVSRGIRVELISQFRHNSPHLTLPCTGAIQLVSSAPTISTLPCHYHRLTDSFYRWSQCWSPCKLAPSLLCCDVPGIAFFRVRQCYKSSPLAKTYTVPYYKGIEILRKHTLCSLRALCTKLDYAQRRCRHKMSLVEWNM